MEPVYDIKSNNNSNNDPKPGANEDMYIYVYGETGDKELCRVTLVYPTVWMATSEIIEVACAQMIDVIQMNPQQLCLRDSFGTAFERDERVYGERKVHLCSAKADATREGSMPVKAGRERNCTVYVDDTLVAGGIFLDVPRDPEDVNGITRWCCETLGLPVGDYLIIHNKETEELIMRKRPSYDDPPMALPSLAPTPKAQWVVGPESCIEVLVTSGERRSIPIPNMLGCAYTRILKAVLPPGENLDKYMLIDVNATPRSRVLYPTINKLYMVVLDPAYSAKGQWVEGDTKKSKTE